MGRCGQIWGWAWPGSRDGRGLDSAVSAGGFTSSAQLQLHRFHVSIVRL